MPVNKDPRWAVIATVVFLILVSIPALSIVAWCVVKVWVDILHMTGR